MTEAGCDDCESITEDSLCASVFCVMILVDGDGNNYT